MPYIERNTVGKIVAVFGPEQFHGQEFLADDHADIILFRDGPPLTYADLRRKEYPSVGDQLGAILKGGAELDAIKAAVAAVNAKYPKPA